MKFESFSPVEIFHILRQKIELLISRSSIIQVRIHYSKVHDIVHNNRTNNGTGEWVNGWVREEGERNIGMFNLHEMGHISGGTLKQSSRPLWHRKMLQSLQNHTVWCLCFLLWWQCRPFSAPCVGKWAWQNWRAAGVWRGQPGLFLLA